MLNKKAVMFGKLSQLNHSYFVCAKKAAMFGLDARIALAIFGALSVITGAALFSAIGNAKATALLTEMQEVGKAFEQYYLDTGLYLPPFSTVTTENNYYALQTRELVENTKNYKNWNGPYLSYAAQTTGNTYVLKYPTHGTIMAIKTGDYADWGDNAGWSAAKCTSGKKCYLWVTFTSVPNDSMAKIIDKAIDKGDGSNKGNFRWGSAGTTVPICYYLKYMPVKNPHD